MATRSNRRISRELLIGLGAVLMLAVIFWAYNLGKGRGAAQAKADDPPAGTPAMEAAPRVQVTPSAPAVAPVADSTDAAPDAPASDAGDPADADAADQTPDARTASTTQPAAPLLGAVATTPTAEDATTRPADAAQTAAHSGQAQRTGSATPSISSSSPLAESKALLDQGHLLEARDILNSALLSLKGDDQTLAKQMLNEINEVVVFSPRQFADDKLGGTFTVPPGGVLERIARSHDVSAELLMRINGITDPRRLQAGQTLKVIKGPFNAIVDKTDFMLELWIGEPNSPRGQYITSFPVGLGANDATPTGIWAVDTKLNNPTYYSPRGQGVIDADDPKNPLGERWISLIGTEGNAVGKTSYGIHGTIEPESIGKQESMGCIRLTNENVARVYEVLEKGKSTVTVRE